MKIEPAPEHTQHLIVLATVHRKQWGDSAHHALADECLRMVGLLAQAMAETEQLRTLSRAQAEQVRQDLTRQP